MKTSTRPAWTCANPTCSSARHGGRTLFRGHLGLESDVEERCKECRWYTRFLIDGDGRVWKTASPYETR